MSEYIFKPRCTDDFELDERDKTNPVDWYGTLHGEIVRCRDCRYCCEFAPDLFDCEWWGAEKKVIEDIDGFCAWGVKK